MNKTNGLTGGALAGGIKAYAERRSLMFEASLSRWDSTNASYGPSLGPVPIFVLSKLGLAFVEESNNRATARTVVESF